MNRFLQIGGALVGAAIGTSVAQAQTLVDNVHADIAIGGEFVGDVWEWEPHIHDETNNVEYEDLANTLLIANALTATTSSDAPLDNALYADLFSTSSVVYHMDQNEQAGELFLGFGSEELDPAQWNGALTFTTTSVTGPGDLVIFSYPYSIVTDTRDGLDASDAFDRLAGSHGHLNLAFTAPGDYAVTFLIEGQFSDDLSVPSVMQGQHSSVQATWNFRVVPGPGAATLAVLGGFAAARRRR